MTIERMFVFLDREWSHFLSRLAIAKLPRFAQWTMIVAQLFINPSCACWSFVKISWTLKANDSVTLHLLGHQRWPDKMGRGVRPPIRLWVSRSITIWHFFTSFYRFHLIRSKLMLIPTISPHNSPEADFSIWPKGAAGAHLVNFKILVPRHLFDWSDTWYRYQTSVRTIAQGRIFRSFLVIFPSVSFHKVRPIL